MAIRTYTSGDLPTSNRYIVFNIQIVLESQSIEGNYSNVTVREIYRRTNTGYQTYGTGTCYAQIDGTEYTQAVSPSQRIVGSDMGSPITLFERNVNIYHSADGTRGLTVYGKISIPGAGLSGDYQGYSITLPTIPRASTPDTPQLTIGNSLSISVSRASSSFTHTLVFSAYGVSKTLTGIGSSGTFSFTASEIASLYAGIPNSNTGAYSLSCTTYSGSTNIGSKTVSGTIRVDPARAAPIFSAFNFSASRTDLTGDSSKIISGVSSVTVTIPVADKAISTTSASIVKYIASVGNATAEAPWSEDAYVYIEVPNAASGTVSVAAVDSRGNQTIVTKLGTLIPYTPPRVSSITTQRANSVDSAVSLQAQGVWDNKSFGLVTNTLSAQYRYKLTTAQEYSDPIAITLTINENSWQFNDTISGDLGVDGFTITSSFDVLLEITDAVPISGSGQSLVDRGIPTMHMTQDGISVGQMMPDGLPEGVVNAATGFAVNGSTLDYIVDSGVTDGWTYRKWASGIIECWKREAIGAVQIANLAEYQYYSDTMYLYYPVELFKTVTHANISVFNNGRVFTVSNLWLYSVSVGYRLMSSYRNETYEGAYVTGYIVGEWK